MAGGSEVTLRRIAIAKTAAALSFGALAACAAPAQPRAAAAGPAPISSDQAGPTAIGADRLARIGWPAIAARNPRFVVFGERHGTVEAPRVFGQIAADLAVQGQRLLIAVELSASGNGDLQAAWNGPHPAFAERLTTGEWRIRDDGVTSLAMLDMLTQLHALKERGAPIDVVAFNGPRDGEQFRRLHTANSQAGHEQMQAENILTAANAGQHDLVLVLVGSLHASRTVIDYVGPDEFEPMAMHLARVGPLVSLAMLTGGGTAWNCIGMASGLACREHPVRGLDHAGEAPQLGLGALPGMQRADSYDGYFWVGQVTASPPARAGQPTVPAGS